MSSAPHADAGDRADRVRAMTTKSGSVPEENVSAAGGREASPSPASPELTGGEGYTYEDGVAGVYAVALLCETTAPGLPGRTVTRLSLQQGAFGEPLDDVVVDGVAADSTTARLSLQVKRSLVVSGAESNVDFRETILRAHATLVRPGFRRTVDRVGVVTGEISDGRKRVFEALCEWARTSIDAPSFIRKVRSDEHRSALDAVRSILAGTLPEAALDEAEHLLLSHFVLMRFEMLHEGSVTEASTVASLADNLHATERSRA